MRELLAAGASPDAVGLAEACGPLEAAISSRSAEAVSELLRAGADANARPHLALAAKVGDAGVIEALIHAGARLGAAEADGAIVSAIARGDGPLASRLLHATSAAPSGSVLYAAVKGGLLAMAVELVQSFSCCTVEVPAPTCAADHDQGDVFYDTLRALARTCAATVEIRRAPRFEPEVWARAMSQRDVARSLATAMHERLGSQSPMQMVGQTVLREIAALAKPQIITLKFL